MNPKMLETLTLIDVMHTITLADFISSQTSRKLHAFASMLLTLMQTIHLLTHRWFAWHANSIITHMASGILQGSIKIFVTCTAIRRISHDQNNKDMCSDAHAHTSRAIIQFQLTDESGKKNIGDLLIYNTVASIINH